MNDNKIEKLKAELAQLSSVTEKLNYWKLNYLEKYPEEQLKTYFELTPDTEEALSGVLRIPITYYKLVPDLHNPRPEYSNKKDRIEYNFWVLCFTAETTFKNRTLPKILDELKNKLGIYKLEGDYNRIKKLRESAIKKLKQGEIDIYDFRSLTDEHLYLWYENNFYSKYEFDSSSHKCVRSIITHKFEFPYLEKILKDSKKVINSKIIISEESDFDFSKFVNELLQRRYFHQKSKTNILEWFAGVETELPIKIEKPMNHFASVIASMIENRIISNTKKDCCQIIQNSFLFKNQRAATYSIENAMKPGNASRITSYDKRHFVEVTQFIGKK